MMIIRKRLNDNKDEDHNKDDGMMAQRKPATHFLSQTGQPQVALIGPAGSHLL